jgi:anaerobic sulfite reductase subunit B
VYETLDVQGDKDHSGLPTEHLSAVLNNLEHHPDMLLTCGPEAMMSNVAKMCVDLGFKSTDIWMSVERRMRCGVGLCGHCYIGSTFACKNGPTYSYDEFIELEKSNTVTHLYHQHFQYC